jgi:hypothetical protein
MLIHSFATQLFLAAISTLLAAVVATNACQSPTSPDVSPLAFRPLTIAELERQGSGTVLAEHAIPASEKSFESHESWSAFWSATNTTDLPRVDFSASRLIGVFLGPSGPGHRVRIDRVTYSAVANETVVHYTKLLPNPQRIYPTVVVYPSVVAEIERRPGSVRFTHDEAINPD